MECLKRTSVSHFRLARCSFNIFGRSKYVNYMLCVHASITFTNVAEHLITVITTSTARYSLASLCTTKARHFVHISIKRLFYCKNRLGIISTPIEQYWFFFLSFRKVVLLEMEVNYSVMFWRPSLILHKYIHFETSFNWYIQMFCFSLSTVR